MGEQILREEGFAVETVADGAAAFAQLAPFDPLVILADVQLPGKSGYDLSQEAKSILAGGVAVVLTVAARAEAPDPEQIRKCGSDGIISKPFEATALIEMVQRLAATAEADRLSRKPKRTLPDEIDRERVESAVTLALEASLPALIQEITERVLIALRK